MLIMYTKNEFQLEIIMVGVKWCTAVMKHQVVFKVHILCFINTMTPSFRDFFWA
jgi:hypothetical protein